MIMIEILSNDIGTEKKNMKRKSVTMSTETGKVNTIRWYCIYSRTSLSRTRLFRITAYLEVKIWSLFKHETMTTGNKIMWKRGEIAPKEQFLLFFHIIIYIYF